MRKKTRVLLEILTILIGILAQWHATEDLSLGNLNISAILDAQLRGYDKRIRPNYGGTPVDVGVTMFILSISSINEVQMDYTMDFYFRQLWTDARLGFKAQTTKIQQISVGAELTSKIWVPDTFFVNEKSAYFHSATTDNSFLRISAEGQITRSIRLTVTAACPMDLQYFPMDRQLCKLEIESFGYTMSDIRYLWAKGENSVGIDKEVQLPQFKVMGHRQKISEINLTTGNYSRLACEIQFVRSMGYYLIQIYVPSTLIVVISWVSFWLNRNATPARVSLGVTTVLTMTTLMSSTNAALPKVSYVKSIDVYLGTCFVMVFGSLLEYAVVGYLGKRIQMRKTRLQALQKQLAEQAKANLEINHAAMAEQGPAHMECPSRGHPAHRSQEFRFKPPPPLKEDPEAALAKKDFNRLCGITSSDIDKYSRVIFPVCFVCFNLTYWTIYLHISDDMPEDIVPLDED